MTIPKSLVRTDNEDNKFVNDSDGCVAVNTVSEVSNDASNPIPVEIVDGTIGANFDLYDEVLAVAGSSTATILTYMVPLGQTLTMRAAEVSGENVAEYTVKVDGVVKAKKRSYWGDFDRTFNLQGVSATAGQTVTIEVNNFRNSTGDFNATLLGVV